MTCKIDGCAKPVKALGLCGTHYMRQRRTGDPTKVRPPGVPGNLRKHPLYVAWAGMVNRCHNPNNASYPRYGARGVIVCDRWRHGTDAGMTGFEAFLSDMGERPAGMTLDRIDPRGAYEPGNCRWATLSEQRRNITPEGDKRMREAISAGVKRRWANLRAKGQVST